MVTELRTNGTQSMSDKRKALEKVLAKMKDKDPDMRLGFGAVEPITFLPTPWVTLNNLNGGGIPKGKFGVLAGPSQTAKTTLLIQVIAHNQQLDPNFTAMWTDAENSVDNTWFEKLGVDMNRLIVQKYDTVNSNAEKLLDNALDLVKTQGIDMWVIDSIGALLPKAEQGKKIEENAMLDIQRKLGSFFRKAIIDICERPGWEGCACVLIGQVYNVPTQTGVGLEEVRGGNSVKHWAYWRWKVRRGNKDEGPAEINVRFPDGRVGKIRPGWAQHIKQDKSKVNDKESQEIILQFIHGRGLDSTNAAITALIANEVVAREGAMYKHSLLPDGKIRGRENLITFLQQNKEVRESLVKEMDQMLTERQVNSGVEITDDIDGNEE